ncbi:MAG TPA: hypothetical protein DEO70_06390 [Bacteroidales bacterium]|nr:MAG: hypothetical protein A2X11_08435 [Bacteroidetes bacterium GWE2_42_24]OFY30949.1 MAG: hypothetical protein A2X09_17210 [Bacteroidetes bacterium GWF2_43_11]HBZ66449.1 hypothetical protein [Bacteroidales bacterium]
MNRFLYFAVVALIGITLMFGCKSRNSELSNNVVDNPMSADGNNNNPSPAIKFEVEEHDFGKIIAGEKVTFNFKFRNTGNADLLLTKVSASCGCTAPSFPTTPIAPGKEGVVSVSFNSENRSGFQNKTITVLTNSIPNSTQLRIKARVMRPEDI